MDTAASDPARAAVNPYDAVPYPDYVFPATHPDHLATIALTHGLKPAPVEGCRVLELGCAAGANLIPMAEGLPGSTFVGVDYSAGQIETGKAVVAELGLGNIQLRHQDIHDIGAEAGLFDYIICHGIYSWVPGGLREKILDICQRNLAGNGLAVVSYNTLPGWSLRSVIREMMCYHTRHLADPRQRIGQARALLDFVAQSVPPNRKNYAAGLGEEIAAMRTASDNYLLHDHMAEVNHACYFHEFVTHAMVHDLQYLADGQAHTMHANDVAPEVRAKVLRLGDVIEQQQCFDFIRNRAFRQTVLCHKHQAVRREYDSKVLRGLYIASLARPGPNVDCNSAREDEFFTESGVRFTTPSPVGKAMVLALSKVYPARILFDELARQPFIAPAGSAPAAETDPFGPAAALLWELYNHDAAEFYTRPIDFSLTPGPRPKARHLARIQARKARGVTNFLHKTVALDPLTKLVITLLDGTRGRDELVGEMERGIGTVPLPAAADLSRLAAPQRRQELGKILDDIIPKLAAAALLVG